MIRKIHHLGIAVESIAAGLALYQDVLGLTCAHTEEVPEQKVRTAMLPVGDTRIELLEPTDPEGAIAKFMEKRGPGIHHVALEVPDIEAALAALSAAGTPLIDKTPRTGVGGTRIAFLHPKGTAGVLIELVQNPTD
jgi:methylmalonyl-CoA/ethylmalonyl-CoA epimerase